MANIETVDIEHLPLEHDIAHQAGDAYRKLWTLERTATAETAAVALTDVTWALVIADAPSGGTAKLSKATTAVWTASGIYVDSAANGQFTVFVTAADADTFWFKCTDGRKVSFGGTPGEILISPDGKNAAVEVQGSLGMRQMQDLSKLPPDKLAAALIAAMGVLFVAAFSVVMLNCE